MLLHHRSYRDSPLFRFHISRAYVISLDGVSLAIDSVSFSLLVGTDSRFSIVDV